MNRRHGLLVSATLLTGCIDAKQLDRPGDVSFVSAPSLDSTTPLVPAAPGVPVAGTTGATGAAGKSGLPMSPLAQAGGSTSAGVAAPRPEPPPSAAGSGATVSAAGGGGLASAGRAASNAGERAPAAGSGVPVAGNTSAAGSGETAPHAGTLTVQFTSVNQSGQYAPRNVGAVWIETASGQFIKTLERWGNIRAVHLTRWNAASGGWGSTSIFGGGGTGNAADKADAISRATLRTHETHMLTWDMQDLMNKVVADGSYAVLIEVTDDERRAGATASIAFEKGAAPQMVQPADKSPYAKLTLTYTP